ncbi:MAG: methyltransferase [Rhodospirillales bacterium]|nr:methyltransferase [Rhodospirillales bacterium]
MIEASEGWLLGGRLRYRQPREGFRSGIEPVLLAAAVPAEVDSHVLEGGTGAGAGLLCLAARVAGVRGLGVEQDAGLAALARENLAANGFAGISVAVGDIRAPRLAAGRQFDHAFANPPWHAASVTAPTHPGRVAAKQGGETLGAWIVALARRLRRRGTLALILPAALVPTALAAAGAAGCGSTQLFPLWPREGRPAKLVLMRVTRAGQGPLRLLAGLVLQGPDGRSTTAAEAVLRGGAALGF